MCMTKAAHLTALADAIIVAIGKANEQTIRREVARQAGLLSTKDQDAIVRDILSRPKTY